MSSQASWERFSSRMDGEVHLAPEPMVLVLCIDWFLFVILITTTGVNALSFPFPVQLLRCEESLRRCLGQGKHLVGRIMPMGWRTQFGRTLNTTLSCGSL